MPLKRAGFPRDRLALVLGSDRHCLKLGVVCGFCFSGCDVANWLDKPAIVERADPFEGGELDGSEAAPRPPPMDGLGLEQPDAMKLKVCNLDLFYRSHQPTGVRKAGWLRYGGPLMLSERWRRRREMRIRAYWLKRRLTCVAHGSLERMLERQSGGKADRNGTRLERSGLQGFAMPEYPPIDGIACRGARAMLGISQGKLCERAGCGRSLLNDFENGLRVPKASSAARIREALEALGAVFIAHGERYAVGVRLATASEKTARGQSIADGRGRVSRLARSDRADC